MMSGWIWPLLVFAATAIAATIATRVVLAILQRRAILDLPNERSSHAQPTPRGGGIAVVAILLPCWALIDYFEPGVSLSDWLVLVAILALAILSWFDDLRGLSAGLRIVCHGLAVAAVLAALPADALIFQGWLPPLADRLATGLLWLWFVNLFNFMDGIDGISGVEALSIAVGLVLVIVLSGDVLWRREALLAMALAGSAFGFLLWNWHPARLFLGDVGSVPLGFALGWLLILAAIAGYWATAAILPLYYFADATITLCRRALRGEKIWQAHREHFYQQAVAGGRDHAAVVRIIALGNLGLIVLALLAEAMTGSAKFLVILAAVATVALLLRCLVGGGRRTIGRPDP